MSRRENELKLPHGWICYLAPEIVKRMGPGNDEDRLPFSNAADVYAFGYEPTPIVSDIMLRASHPAGSVFNKMR